MRNDSNKPRENDNGKNTTVRGTRVRRKEKQYDKKDDKCRKSWKNLRTSRVKSPSTGK